MDEFGGFSEIVWGNTDEKINIKLFLVNKAAYVILSYFIISTKTTCFVRYL